MKNYTKKELKNILEVTFNNFNEIFYDSTLENPTIIITDKESREMTNGCYFDLESNIIKIYKGSVLNSIGEIIESYIKKVLSLRKRTVKEIKTCLDCKKFDNAKTRLNNSLISNSDYDLLYQMINDCQIFGENLGYADYLNFVNNKLNEYNRYGK